jgi:hypothetical protein
MMHGQKNIKLCVFYVYNFRKNPQIPSAGGILGFGTRRFEEAYCQHTANVLPAYCQQTAPSSG